MVIKNRLTCTTYPNTQINLARKVLYTMKNKPDEAKGRVLIPLFGKISCRKLGFMDCDIDGYFEFPKSMIGNGEYFALHADGDSMVEAGINHGDVVIIEKHPAPENGRIAVIRVGDEVLLKRFYRLEKEKKYLLHPENAAYQDIIVDECEVLGIAIKVLKDL